MTNKELLETIEEETLDFNLGEEQKECILSVIEWCFNSNVWVINVSGKAGVGKSLCIKMLIEFFERRNYKYQVTAPTNKACINISRNFKRLEIYTIHKLLNLRPNLSIMDYDANNLLFEPYDDSNNIKSDSYLILDECSMVNSDLYEFLTSACLQKNTKIISFGDEKQLHPVKEHSVSKFFSKSDKKYSLTKVYRQDESNPIYPLLDSLRVNPLSKFEEISSEFGELKLYDKAINLINDALPLYRDALLNKSDSQVRLLAYTNKRVELFNRAIRLKLFNTRREYVPGEILMGYDNCINNGIYNSEDYSILKCEEDMKIILDTRIPGWKLKILDIQTKSIHNVFIMSRSINKDVLDTFCSKLFKAHTRAVRLRKWNDFFKACDKFLTPFDLCYDGKCIKRKSIDYGYCISVHKSQSQSITNVLIDMKDILTCRNREELRQLQYVGLSRTRNNIYMLF